MLSLMFFPPTDFNGDKENGKIGLFIAASVGTFTLMIAVYCIYNRFYTKHQYLHTQLTDDPGTEYFWNLELWSFN